MTKKKKMLHFKQKVTAKNELAIFFGGGPENEFQSQPVTLCGKKKK